MTKLYLILIACPITCLLFSPEATAQDKTGTITVVQSDPKEQFLGSWMHIEAKAAEDLFDQGGKEIVYLTTVFEFTEFTFRERRITTINNNNVFVERIGSWDYNARDNAIYLEDMQEWLSVKPKHQEREGYVPNPTLGISLDNVSVNGDLLSFSYSLNAGEMKEILGHAATVPPMTLERND